MMDEVPVIRAGDELFAEEADVQDGDERELGSELHAGKHGSDGGDNDDKGHWGEIALCFFIGLGEERDGHEGGGEKDGDGQCHEKDRDNRLGSELEEKTCRRCTSAGGLSGVVTQD